MFDIRHSHSFTLTGAQLVTPEAVITGGLSVENGVITDLHEGRAEGLDLQGDYLIPGIVDVHTDHAETHVVPRAGVQWNFDAALMAHDGVVISGGTTTVFDSLSVGASMKKPERREILGPLVQALADGVAKGRFRAEHMLHMRCEICDPATIELVNQTIGLPITRLVSVMDHTPGDRQSPDIDSWMRAMARDMQIDLHTAQDMTDELLTRSARVGAEVRAHVISQALARDLPLMTHDDRSCEHVDQSSAEGITVSEFPCTHEAASRARELGQIIVAGAPNYLRGGSQSGNVAVKELLAAGLVDVLASDYVPRSPLDAAFAIAEDPELPYSLSQTSAMVSRNPARLAGLTDRGEIALGQRADLVWVHRADGINSVRGVWRQGRRVF